MTFRPGPWKVYQPRSNDIWIISADGYTICRVSESENANLIAAVPELFEACKILVAWAKGNYLIGMKNEPPGIQEAIEAIRKAKPDCKLILNLGD